MRGTGSTTAQVRLYPDLGEFYHQGVVEYGSSVDIPIATRVLPSAPPPSEPDLDTEHRLTLAPQTSSSQRSGADGFSATAHAAHPKKADQFSATAHSGQCGAKWVNLNITVPEEPALDYTLEPDYDLEDLPDLNDLNLNDEEKKILKDKQIEFPPQPKDKKDYNAWLTWRRQVNRQLASVILIKRGRHVHLRRSELQRRPLSKQNVESVVKDAKGGKGGKQRADGAETTSLPSRPYIMYGIPRVKLSSSAAARH